MQIRIKMPSPMEATWRYDENTNELIVEPHFYNKTSLQTIGYLETDGDSGQSVHGVLRVSGRTGRVSAVYKTVDPVKSDFDAGVKPTAPGGKQARGNRSGAAGQDEAVPAAHPHRT